MIWLMAPIVFVLMTVSSAKTANEPWRTDPAAFINHFAELAIDDILMAEVSDEEKISRLRTLFKDDFDIPAIGRFVLARNWRRANDTEKQEFLDLFEDVIVYTWSRRFGEYDGQVLDIRGTVPDGESGMVVDSVIVDKIGQTVSVQWRLRLREEGLRIVDIIVEGVSMAITYRQDYASVIRQNGGLNGLIEELRRQKKYVDDANTCRKPRYVLHKNLNRLY